MSSPRWTGKDSRLMRQNVGSDHVWRATYVTPAGYHLHSTLDLATAEKLARMSVGADRHEWHGEDPVGILREPMPNGHRRPGWLARFVTWLDGHLPPLREE
jgi:hypothetical protein